MNDISPQQQEGPASSRAISNVSTRINATHSVLVNEEEQRVSSTSSPARHHQNNLSLSAGRGARGDLTQEHASSPAQITSTTASPPQPMRDDEEQQQRHQNQRQHHQPVAESSANSMNALAASGAESGCSSHQQHQELQPDENTRKIILKLPKPMGSRSHESHSSQNCANNDCEDPRRVEPIRIHLPACSSSSASVSSPASASVCISPLSAAAASNAQTVPKITIKQIKKQSDVAATSSDASSCSCSSSCAEDEMNACCNSSSRNNATDIPHILPKLTIRATNEGRGTPKTTTVVPKLVIKMPDSCVGANSAASEQLSTKMLCAANRQLEPPPLPKLTIKTGVDGTSESIISSISPTSASSSTSSTESSASCSPLVNVLSITQKTMTTTSEILPSGQQQVVPKLSIKQLQKDAGGGTAIPKLTIKTTLAQNMSSDDVANLLSMDAVAENTSNKIPKMTIKTGQEHTVIMTHDVTNAQSIPKLTIKTRSFDVDESAGLNCESQHMQPPEKIARMTIRESGGERMSPTVPKLTISVGGGTGLDAARCPSSPGTALVVRQSTSSISPMDRVPKLMISRQPQQQEVSMNNCNEQSEAKTSSALNSNVFGMRSDAILNDVNSAERIPKLNLNSTIHEEFGNSQYHIPKLTIKNLCSPKHKMRAVLEDKSAKITVNKKITLEPLINGGESSSSQDFCGFNDADETLQNSDDMDIDDALHQEHDPQMFHNFSLTTSNNGDLAPTTTAITTETLKQQRPSQHATRVIDTVDLTSSPSPGSSPTYNNVSDATTAMRYSQPIICLPQNSVPPCSNILFGQLTGPQKKVTAPSLLSAGAGTTNTTANKYPQLTERLLAKDGISKPTEIEKIKPKIIDSIEILDTPEGSPQPQLQTLSALSNADPLNNHVAGRNYQKVDIRDSTDVLRLNNNTMMNSAMTEVNSLKRNSQKKNSGFSPNNKQMHFDKTGEQEQIPTNLSCPEMTTVATSPAMVVAANAPQKASTSNHHRSRKQKHEHILNTELDDSIFSNSNNLVNEFFDVSNNNSDNSLEHQPPNTATPGIASLLKDIEPATPATTGKRRGRPKRHIATPHNSSVATVEADLSRDTVIVEDGESTSAVKSRRVQLLRKRLAIDMVSAEQPPTEATTNAQSTELSTINITPEVGNRRDQRPLRASRRGVTPNKTLSSTAAATKATRKRQSKIDKAELLSEKDSEMNDNESSSAPSILANHFGILNSSASASDGDAATTCMQSNFGAVSPGELPSSNIMLSSQIDLTMCSSSSSASNCSNSMTTVTTTSASSSVSTIDTVGLSAGGGNSNTSSSMLPPVKILSSSDPVPDLVFKPNDFSSIMETQTFNSAIDQIDFNEDTRDASRASSCELSTNTFVLTQSPSRGRGRGRGMRGGRGSGGAAAGVGNNGRGGGTRAPRLGRGASAVAKAIAMSRPRCIGGLKHTPDPERLKELFSPSPQVFEEDTRMSADLGSSINVPLMEPPLTPQKQDFLSNEESQSSVISNTSILDASMGSSLKRLKKKKMEVCVSEDTEFSASTIAEYDWPPPKGCCPSKNRDTFMIQEQVALYLGIKSFKRKYPDLPRRAVDMEERNWLQEKGLVSEKMCDLGLTAVWASDILDIMYADFYDKYEEYKEYIRQKHLRVIEAKQKALGLSVGTGRGLQARDRAMLSASKWNAYLNKTRKDERQASLDLQTFTTNLPLPRNAPHSKVTLPSYRPFEETGLPAENAEEENVYCDMPSLCDDLSDTAIAKSCMRTDNAYPLSLVPGQFGDKYCRYTPLELRSFPVNTVLDDPLTLAQRIAAAEQEEQLEFNALDDKQQQALKQQAFDDLNADAANKISDDNDNGQDAYEHAAVTVILPSAGQNNRRMPIRRSRRARLQQCAVNKMLNNTTKRNAKVNNMITTGAEHSVSSCASSSGSNSSDDDDADNSSDSNMTDSENDTCSSTSSSSDNDDTDDNVDEDVAFAKCGVCHSTQHKNQRSMPELFIQCYTCRKNVHPSCIEMPHRMVSRVRNYNWQCAECKCCIKCKQKQEPNKMLYCEQCDRGYHIYCLGVKTVPDGRWSCERCSFCMRCGATKPEGLPLNEQLQLHQGQMSPNADKVKPVKHKKVKWINEYRIDHITKLREHCSMLCVPCARMKPAKRVQATASSSSSGSGSSSGCILSAVAAKLPTTTTTTSAPAATVCASVNSASTAAAACAKTTTIALSTNTKTQQQCTVTGGSASSSFRQIQSSFVKTQKQLAAASPASTTTAPLSNKHTVITSSTSPMTAPASPAPVSTSASLVIAPPPVVA